MQNVPGESPEFRLWHLTTHLPLIKVQEAPRGNRGTENSRPVRARVRGAVLPRVCSSDRTVVSPGGGGGRGPEKGTAAGQVTCGAGPRG